MMIASGLMVTFFFGGFGIPGLTPAEAVELGTSLFGGETAGNIFNTVIHFLSYNVKFAIFLWIFIHVRWTLPRFRYDQLMDLGWKTMLPWALGNTIFTAVVIYAASTFVL